MFSLLSVFFDGVLFDKAFDFVYIFKSIISKWYLYLLLVFAIITIVIVFCVVKPKKRNALTKTQRITYMAVFSALGFVVNALDISMPLVHFSLVATIACIGGVLLGPIDGFMCAFIGDLIAGIIVPKGVYSPIIGLSTGLMGLVPGVAFAYFKGKPKVKIFICYTITFILSSVILNTIGLSLIYPKYYVLTERLLLLPITFVCHAVNCAITVILLNVIVKVLPNNKFLINDK